MILGGLCEEEENAEKVWTFVPHTVPARWRRVVDWSRSAGADWSTGQHNTHSVK